MDNTVTTTTITTTTTAGAAATEKRSITVAIVGGRDFNDEVGLNARMNDLFDEYNITRVVSGGAKGADSLGAKWARSRNIPTTIYLPDWKKYGRRAGIVRNADIINAASMVVAFWDGHSPGTKNSIERGEKKGITVLIEHY